MLILSGISFIRHIQCRLNGYMSFFRKVNTSKVRCCKSSSFQRFFLISESQTGFQTRFRNSGNEIGVMIPKVHHSIVRQNSILFFGMINLQNNEPYLIFRKSWSHFFEIMNLRNIEPYFILGIANHISIIGIMNLLNNEPYLTLGIISL